MSSILFKKITPNARTPTKATNLSAGFDLYSPNEIKIPSGKIVCVYTNIEILSIPDGCYCRIAARSGMSLNSYVTVLDEGGIINCHNTNVRVILYNFGNKEYTVFKGDRIAQLICEKIFYFRLLTPINLYFKPMSPIAFMPTTISSLSSIFNLYSPIQAIIPSKETLTINLKVELILPNDKQYYGRITSRPGMSLKHYVTVLEENITSNEELRVTLYNFGETSYEINKGNNIAQIILEKIVLISQVIDIDNNNNDYDNDSTFLCFKKLAIDAKSPSPIDNKSSARFFDLYNPFSIITIPSKKVVCISTHLQIILPDNEDCYGRIASNWQIDNVIVLGGVIDKDYKGDVGVILYNFGENDQIIRKGDKIAHLICQKIYYPSIMEMVPIGKKILNNSNNQVIRGSQGFGSSGGYNNPLLNINRNLEDSNNDNRNYKKAKDDRRKQQSHKSISRHNLSISI